MTVINQPSSFQSRFLYSKLSNFLLQCGLAWGYSCCFHFSELVTRQLTFASLKAQHYVKLLCTTPNRQLTTSKFYVDFKKNFSNGPKNDTHLLFFDVLLLVGHFFELKNSHVRSFYLLRTHKRSSDGIFSSHP